MIEGKKYLPFNHVSVLVLCLLSRVSRGLSRTFYHWSIVWSLEPLRLSLGVNCKWTTKVASWRGLSITESPGWPPKSEILPLSHSGGHLEQTLYHLATMVVQLINWYSALERTYCNRPVVTYHQQIIFHIKFKLGHVIPVTFKKSNERFHWFSYVVILWVRSWYVSAVFLAFLPLSKQLLRSLKRSVERACKRFVALVMHFTPPWRVEFVYNIWVEDTQLTRLGNI